MYSIAKFPKTQDVSSVHIYSCDELTEEEIETIESNYPNAYYSLQ